MFRALVSLSYWLPIEYCVCFSPSGKLVQIEYALQAVAAGAPSVGIKGNFDNYSTCTIYTRIHVWFVLVGNSSSDPNVMPSSSVTGLASKPASKSPKDGTLSSPRIYLDCHMLDT